MAFIAQCPHCMKYMILEDGQREGRVKCLIPGCSKWFDLDPSMADMRSPPDRAPHAGGCGGETGSPIVQRHRLVRCPVCNSHLRVLSSGKSESIRCPKCNQVFHG
jgi:hypothetical protein